MADCRRAATRVVSLRWGGGGDLPEWQGSGGGGVVPWLRGIPMEKLRRGRTYPLPFYLWEIMAQDVAALVVGSMAQVGEVMQRCPAQRTLSRPLI